MVKEVKNRPTGKDLVPSSSGSTQAMAVNIKVVVRVRPLNKKESESAGRIAVDVVDDTMLVFDPKEKITPFFYQGVQQPNKNFLKRANKELKFVFDAVCGQDATNKDVFEISTKDMLSSLMEGYNCSVFVYGATGAGKTYTMTGNKQNPGITYLTMEHLFFIINSFKHERDFDIGVSYIEVYNENVYDLLKPSKTPLQLREDTKYGVMVAGLTIKNIETAQELLNMLENGNKNRTQHPTDANADSSRSHAVFQVYVKMRHKTSRNQRIVKLSMIDLAGSERASATGCVGARFKEGANINRSLLSLGNCINKLADGSNYIPYRDSKLTRLLKDSLGGNCKTVMIANISPSSNSYEDTYNTLKYAARANKIQLSVKKNIVSGDMRVSEYVKLIEELKKKVKELEAKLSLSIMQPPVQEKASETSNREAQQQWRQRIAEENKLYTSAESEVLALMSRQRVLALRRRLRARAFAHLAGLAHRSSSETMDQMCTEDLPRQERAAEHFMKQAIQLDSKILGAWNKCNEIKKKLQVLCKEAISACPDLQDFIDKIYLQSELRQAKARDNLRLKLLAIEHDEINAFTDYMSDMPSMLKKLYLTLKGYDKAPPSLTTEYLNIIKKAKSVKAISWSDNESNNETMDQHFKFISSLNLDKPTTTPDFYFTKSQDDVTDISDSEDLTDIENREPVQMKRKRKGTPIKMPNNDTIIIDDSFDTLDSTKILSSLKKIKKEDDPMLDVENFRGIEPLDLNSTFVLAGKVEALKKHPVKVTTKVEPNQPVRRMLMDKTNPILKQVTFNDKAKVVRPAVGKTVSFRRPVGAAAPAVRSLNTPRENTACDVQAVRPRQRVQNHPYTRPTVTSSERLKQTFADRYRK